MTRPKTSPGPSDGPQMAFQWKEQASRMLWQCSEGGKQEHLRGEANWASRRRKGKGAEGSRDAHASELLQVLALLLAGPRRPRERTWEPALSPPQGTVPVLLLPHLPGLAAA